MESTLKNQELSNQEIKDLISELGLSQRKLAKSHRRKVSQINDAINTSDQPGLRKRIIEHLLKRRNNSKNVSS